MVSSDTGLPDPDNPENNLTVPNEGVILMTDDEDFDDDETVGLDEYHPLPMYETGTDHYESSDENSSEDERAQENEINNATATENVALSPITPIEQTLVKEVWSAPAFKDIEMDSKKVDEVKQVMLNITLPPSSIPEWAANIPEEEWKQQLLKRLQQMPNKSL